MAFTAADANHFTAMERDSIHTIANLLHQGLTYRAVTGKEDINHFLRLTVEELVVHVTNRLLDETRLHDHRDVSFGRTLSRCTYTDAVAAQGGQHTTRCTTVLEHIIAH